MPNRILKESICRSDSIDKLTWFEEVLFYRLIVNCDDYGRFDGREAVIKNILFPLKDNLTTATVRNAVRKLVSAGLVTLYMFEGKPYLYLPTWHDHQNVRAKRSKYPSPPDAAIQADENICMQMYADVPDIRIQSESLSLSVSESISESELADEFERLWRMYPRQEGKRTALAAYQKARLSGVSRETIETGLHQYLSQIDIKKTERKYIKAGSTWFSNSCWEDSYDLTPDQGSKSGNPFLEKLRMEGDD